MCLWVFGCVSVCLCVSVCIGFGKNLEKKIAKFLANLSSIPTSVGKISDSWHLACGVWFGSQQGDAD